MTSEPAEDVARLHAPLGWPRGSVAAPLAPLAVGSLELAHPQELAAFGPGNPGLDLRAFFDLIELLRIAQLRRRAGQALADAAPAHQELLWRELQARMVARKMENGTETEPHPRKRTPP